MMRRRRSKFDPDDGRIRGRAGVALRKARLHDEPLCRACAGKGLTVEAVVPDHIVPLAFGGADTPDNVQSLCAACHADKSAREDASHRGGANHPDWLQPPDNGVQVIVVAGPPCGGKTTYARAHAKDWAGDVIIDIDDIALELDPTYRPWEGTLAGDLLNRCIRVRNAKLGGLRYMADARVFFIVSAPTKAEREWWCARLGAQLVLMDPGLEECRERARARGTPAAADGAAAWYRRGRMPWRGPFDAR